ESSGELTEPPLAPPLPRRGIAPRWAAALVAASIILVLFFALQPKPVERVNAPSAVVEVGDVVVADDHVRSLTGGVVALADQSRVEMRGQTEFALERADDGVRIHLFRGSVIVSAAKQPQGHLYVQTKDVTVSVVGTVFLVNA